MSWIKDMIQALLIAMLIFLLIDLAITSLSGYRGLSKFFISHDVEGRINKPNFSGVFGSVLDEFNGAVTIDKIGERHSSSYDCKVSPNSILFLGDSTTAGFEVDDDKTFVSLFNGSCMIDGRLGINLGVRAHDTHAVIGSYLRVKDDLPHGVVVYLMTSNDFSENVNANAYHTMTKRFGRRFNATIVTPEDSKLFDLYADIRLFVGDRLSLTTFAIAKLALLRDSFSTDELNPESNEVGDDLLNQIEVAYQLISELNSLVSAKGSSLYVIPYPRLSSVQDINRNQLITGLNKKLHSSSSQIRYFNDIDIMVDKIVAEDNMEIQDMRFQKDGHLSEYGHKVISKILKRTIK
jgi:hypothetical protein